MIRYANETTVVIAGQHDALVLALCGDLAPSKSKRGRTTGSHVGRGAFGETFTNMLLSCEKWDF
jgi:hypothetical protein